MYKAITKETKNSVDLLFLCLKSSFLFGNPHELEVKLFMKKDEKHITCKCSCPGGSKPSGQCKPSVAVLLYSIK